MSEPPGYEYTQGLPGTVVVRINAFVNGAAEPEITQSDGRPAPTVTLEGGPPPHQYRGQPLAELRQQYRGDEVTLIDHFLGQTHRISLRPWVDADPNTTTLRFDFVFVPDRPIAPGEPGYPTPPWRRERP